LTTAILILHSVTAGRHATQTPHRRHTDATQTPHRRHTDATQTPDQADARQTKQTQGVWFVHLLQTNRQRTGACHTHVVRGIVARGYRNRGYSRSMAVAVQPCNRGRRGTPWHGLQRSAMQRQIQGPLRLLVAQVQCGGAGEVFSGQLAAQTVVACLHKGSTATVRLKPAAHMACRLGCQPLTLPACRLQRCSHNPPHSTPPSAHRGCAACGLGRQLLGLARAALRADSITPVMLSAPPNFPHRLLVIPCSVLAVGCVRV
jgi:hypothetical protein